MKLALLIFGMAISAVSVMAEDTCPKNWQVTVVERENGEKQNISLIVSKNLVEKNELTGDRLLPFSSSFSPYMEIKGNDVQMSVVIKKSDKVEDEKWTSMGTIFQTEKVGSLLCHNLKLAEGVLFEEVRESSAQDCLFLPKFLCGKYKANKLVIKKKIDGKYYSTSSILSISRNL